MVPPVLMTITLASEPGEMMMESMDSLRLRLLLLLLLLLENFLPLQWGVKLRIALSWPSGGSAGHNFGLDKARAREVIILLLSETEGVPEKDIFNSAMILKPAPPFPPPPLPFAVALEATTTTVES